MGLADQNKRVHRGGRGEGGGGWERKNIFFYKRLQAYTYILSLEIVWEKKKKKRREKKNTLREVNKKLRFLGVCSFKSRQILQGFRLKLFKTG